MARTSIFAERIRTELCGRSDVWPAEIERMADRMHHRLSGMSSDPDAIARLLNAEVIAVPFLSDQNPGCTIVSEHNGIQILVWSRLKGSDRALVVLHECSHAAFLKNNMSHTHVDAHRLALAYAYPRDVLLELASKRDLSADTLAPRGPLAECFAELRIEQAAATGVVFSGARLRANVAR